jgi:hypothetical protein
MLLLNGFVDALPDNFLSDGFSLSLWGKTPHSGFMVSFAGFEKVLENPTITDIVNYVEENSEYLYALPDAYVGGWFDAESGKYFLDISENVQDKEQALWLAAERKQLAIFDLSTFESIYL